MFIPQQGFRHAVDLLLRNGIRLSKTPAQLVEDLVALADDMKAPADAAEWIASEYERLLGDTFPSARLLNRVGANRAATERRDIFLLYVPEDRLPIAGPLAVELAKRRITVALSEYEVASRDELEGALERGLARNRAGVLLATPEFNRKPWRVEPRHPRLLILREVTNPPVVAEQLVAWLANLQ